MLKFYILDLGKIVMKMRNDVTAGGKDPNTGENLEAYPAIPVQAYLIDSPVGYILFDTGCDPEGMKGVWPDWLTGNPYVPGDHGTVVERLAQLGLQPEDIRCVVMSHLHMDHAGSLKYFPQAETFVNESELLETLKLYAEDRMEGNFHLKSDIEACLKAGIRWRMIEDKTKEFQLTEGVKILNFGSGHSFGMLGLLVELESGNVLIASDTVYSREHFGPPAQMAGICDDEKGYFDTIEYIRSYAEAHQAKVLFGHDMEQFKALKKSDQGYYS